MSDDSVLSPERRVIGFLSMMDPDIDLIDRITFIRLESDQLSE